MRRGRQVRLRAGTLLPWTTAPFGYRLDPDRPRRADAVRVDPGEAALVAQLFDWYLEPQGTVYRLARRLTDLGVPTPRGGHSARPSAPGWPPPPSSGAQGLVHAVRGATLWISGTSHNYVSERAAVLLGRPPEELRLVTAHLGNGCSAAAIRDGVSVDTTMGLTPLEGLVMGARSGDVDPVILGYLADQTGQTGQTAKELTHVLNRQSGLRALSGVGNDMRAVEAAAVQGDKRAKLALDVFVYRLAKAVGGLVTSLERLEALVFTAGIGENSPGVRSLVLRRLGFLGLTEDAEANAQHGRQTNGRISRPGPVQALVVPTDEELMIARDTARLIATQPAASARR